MGQPFSQLHILWTGTESQKVTPYVQRGVLLLKEIFGCVGIVCGGAVHWQRRTERRRVGSRRDLGSLSDRQWSGRLGGRVVVGGVIIIVVLVVTSAKPLTTRVETVRVSAST